MRVLVTTSKGFVGIESELIVTSKPFNTVPAIHFMLFQLL